MNPFFWLDFSPYCFIKTAIVKVINDFHVAEINSQSSPSYLTYQKYLTPVIAFSSLIDFILLSSRISHCFGFLFNKMVASPLYWLATYFSPQLLTIWMLQVWFLYSSLFYTYTLGYIIQSCGFKCYLYVNNALVYIFILNLSLKLYSHLSDYLLDILRGPISTYSHTVHLGVQHLNLKGAQYSP